MRYTSTSKQIIDEQLEIYKSKVEVVDKLKIPTRDNFPKYPHKWYRIKDVICVYIDIAKSSQLNVSEDPESTSRLYELFCTTTVKIFNEFDAQYVDVDGDAVFALFNYNQSKTALSAAVTVKTFAEEHFTPLIRRIIPESGVHMAIHCDTVMVKQVGIKDHSSRDSRKNEVWAGELVNTAAKLGSLNSDLLNDQDRQKNFDYLLISERYMNMLRDEIKAIESCDCNGVGELWDPLEIKDANNFSFNKAYKLRSIWCEIHGKDFCNSILRSDKDE